MKLKKSSNSVDEVRPDKDESDASRKADLKDFESSSGYYERRSRIRTKWHQGDSWIAIGLYLVLVSVAFVIL